MDRGVISLTQAEIDYILSLLSKENPAHTALIAKLHIAAKETGDKKNMLINDEQAEIVLDNLGMPVEDEQEMVQTLRTKFQASLSMMNG